MTAQEAITVPHAVRLKVKDFLLLAESGAFAEYARSELIEGEIWVVNAIHSRHARAHAQVTGELFAAREALGLPLMLYTAPSTELSDDSMPEPDIALAEPNDAKMLPGPKVRLAIEISDSTLDMDMGRKARLYAAHGIPEYWVFDVEGRVIHQMWSPQGDAYGERREIAFGERIAAATIEELVVKTAGI